MRRSLLILALALSSTACTRSIAPLPKPFLLTAYAAPVLEASRIQTPTFAAPLRACPTSSPPFPIRKAFAAGEGTTAVLAWIANPLDAYLAEVNGSVRVHYADGTDACLAWVVTNNQPYTSLGGLLVDHGHAERSTIDLGVIRSLHESNPSLVERLMLENDRVVFFESIRCDEWPRASTGHVLHAMQSIAVDPSIIPLGSRVRLQGHWADGTRLDLTTHAIDIGGAIKGERIDLYIGAGSDALRLAGAQRQMITVTVLNP